MKKSLWQSHEWEQFQRNLGRATARVRGTLMVMKPLFYRLSWAYVPRGHFSRHLEDRDSFFSELARLSKRKGLVFVRLDSEEKIEVPERYAVVRSRSEQPETSLLLDLSLGEKELLAQMKRKGRYNIGLAEKRGIRVVKGRKARGHDTREDFVSLFFQLLQQTTERDQFSGHDEHYYQRMLRSLPMAEVMVAFYEEQPIAAGIFVFFEEVALYYYGASSNDHRELMAPYLLQWEAIKEAKKRGCRSYDFLGIAPDGAGEDHPWSGISSFKRKFGGRVVHYPQALDLVFRPCWYAMYRLLKRIRGWFW